MVSEGEVVESQVLLSLRGSGLGGKVAGNTRHFKREFPCISDGRNLVLMIVRFLLFGRAVRQ